MASDPISIVTKSAGDTSVFGTSGPRRGSRELWVELPQMEGLPAAWCYADKRLYEAGEDVRLYVSANVGRVRMRIYRDGATESEVHTAAFDTVFQPVPALAYEVGCDWAVSHVWSTPADARSGGYVIEFLTDEDVPVRLGHHLVFIRNRAEKNSLVLVAATSTWAAYNDWGGANHYYGLHPNVTRGRAPRLSANRPWARGQIWLPPHAPRASSPERPHRPGPARYDFVDWAHVNGYAKYYASAGWATYERIFAGWAEKNGFLLDIITQDELDADPSVLDGYKCAAFVGHDEYWSRRMRDTVDGYVERGGRVLRLAGNFMWQTRLEDDGSTQVCYKFDAPEADPISQTEQSHLMTTAWEHPGVAYPGASTFGVNAMRGIYAGFGGYAQRAARGFQVFREGHWALDGTGLSYADMFGDEANIFSYEVDGLDYTFVDGLPVATHTDGAPEGVEIIAMNFATLAEAGLPEFAYTRMYGDGDAQFRASMMVANPTAEDVARYSRGTGMVVNFQRGKGEVFTAGACEWINGLRVGEFYTETITLNVLNRYCR